MYLKGQTIQRNVTWCILLYETKQEFPNKLREHSPLSLGNRRNAGNELEKVFGGESTMCLCEGQALNLRNICGEKTTNALKKSYESRVWSEEDLEGFCLACLSISLYDAKTSQLHPTQNVPYFFF